MSRQNCQRAVDVTAGCTHFNYGTETYAEYLKEIRKTPVPTQEEEYALFTRIKRGDSGAIEELVKAHQRFVLAVAKKFTNGQNLMDLIEEGNIGMLEAIERFDHKTLGPDGKPVKFISFAVWYIRRQISSYIINTETLIKRTNNIKISAKCAKAKSDFYAQNGRMPVEDEIKEILKEKYDIDIKDNSYLYDIETKLIDNTINDDGDKSLTFENSHAFTEHTSINNEYEETIEKDSAKQKVDALLKTLTERERTIVKKLFGIGTDKQFTIEELADETGLSKERIRQIKMASIKKMKKIYSKVD